MLVSETVSTNPKLKVLSTSIPRMFLDVKVGVLMKKLRS